jgi:23S rRNA (guanosine2251-2'-O)-methyltransferase
VVALVEASMPALSLDELLAQAGDQPQTLLLLDGVTDPRNLGACLRTADAAGAAAVIVPRDRSAAMTAIVAKAAAGAAESTPLVQVTNLSRAMEEIKQAGIWIAGAAGESDRSVYDLDLTGPIAWVLGAEGEGMRRLTREKCDWLARIPMAGAVESLNVSVAAGVCLFETARQRSARKAP